MMSCMFIVGISMNGALSVIAQGVVSRSIISTTRRFMSTFGRTTLCVMSGSV